MSMWISNFVGHGKYIKVCVLLTQKELQSLGHVCCVEVLEPNWHVMHNRLQTAKSIDDVIEYHNFFLEKCLRECLLLLPEVLKKVERLKSICLQYAAATQWLISSSIDIPKLDTTSSEKFKQMKIRKPSSSQALKLATENAAVTDSVLKFEREFNSELESRVNFEQQFSSRAIFNSSCSVDSQCWKGPVS
ncbi:gamma-tubulin complex component 2-like isoform X2 [Camellia sinensis]|uniref:gamma-tubulin complex component 2-like isoform X2 n=1 Tax=Camellia sinensis TaxID=4442 RepID=UPI001036DDD2|nr:gamma-tubulin complex component 2-like isoform X2 [Camellia sinensis]XP_028127484.1 gamma-tubulin complex component 2-like isoform X2 [Camellia sinensis]XP_028127485.1 gamma-tubulin complex component 2-like isoform X2 [Camellia sinensis]